MERLLEDIKTIVRDGQALLQSGIGSVKHGVRAGAERTTNIVRERPYGTLGVAFALGVVAGLLTSSLLSARGEEDEH